MGSDEMVTAEERFIECLLACVPDPKDERLDHFPPKFTRSSQEHSRSSVNHYYYYHFHLPSSNVRVFNKWHHTATPIQKGQAVLEL